MRLTKGKKAYDGKTPVKMKLSGKLGITEDI
jgi:hypothetical protein